MQWQVSTNGGSTFSNLSGATSPTLSFTSSSGQTGNEYRAVFTNSVGSKTTNAATLTVDSPPAITTQPNLALVIAGQTAVFSGGRQRQSPPRPCSGRCPPIGGNTFSNIGGATTDTLAFSTTPAENGSEAKRYSPTRWVHHHQHGGPHRRGGADGDHLTGEHHG